MLIPIIYCEYFYSSKMATYLRAFSEMPSDSSKLMVEFNKFNPEEAIAFINTHKDKYIYEYVRNDQLVKPYFNIHLRTGYTYIEYEFQKYLMEILRLLKSCSDLDPSYSIDNIKVATRTTNIGHKHIILNDVVSTTVDLFLFAILINNSIGKNGMFFTDTTIYKCKDRTISDKYRMVLPACKKDIFNPSIIFTGITTEESLVGIYDTSYYRTIEFKDFMWNKSLIKIYVDRNTLLSTTSMLKSINKDLSNDIDMLEDKYKMLSEDYNLLMNRISELEKLNKTLTDALEQSPLIKQQEFDELHEKYKAALEKISILENLWNHI